MDLGTVQKKLDSGSYHDMDEFAFDVRLTFDNAMTYHSGGTNVWEMIRELKAKFEIEFGHATLESSSMQPLQTNLAFLERKAIQQDDIKSKCAKVLHSLQTHMNGWVFNRPFDPVEAGFPDYFEVIKKPMDLGTVRTKLDSGSYHDMKEFAFDVRLTFENAMTCLPEGTIIWEMARELKAKFETEFGCIL
ncbi:hypothetical protein ACA910_017464 [Epithemia clementina (nom. ined.)]